MSVLTDPGVCQSLLLAWQESNPGTLSAHEEGGFILRRNDGSLIAERWPRGLQDEISVPEHAGGKRNGLTIIATFHTHPNPGAEYLQEPGPTDIRAVRDDPDLGHPEYEGEFVIATELIYMISRAGAVIMIGRTNGTLAGA